MPNQPTQQGNQEQQQQQTRGIFGSHPRLTYDHGSELLKKSELPKKKVDLDELTPPAQDFFPNHTSAAIGR